MKITKTPILVLVLVVAIVSLVVVAKAQQTPSTDAQWMTAIFAQPMQLEWVARDRARITLAGQGSERITVEAGSLTVTTNADGLTISAAGQASLSSPLRNVLTAESLDLTWSRAGSVQSSVRR